MANYFYSVVAAISSKTMSEMDSEMFALMRTRVFHEDGKVTRIDVIDNKLYGPCINQVRWDLATQALAKEHTNNLRAGKQAHWSAETSVSVYKNAATVLDSIPFGHVKGYTPYAVKELPDCIMVVIGDNYVEYEIH